MRVLPLVQGVHRKVVDGLESHPEMSRHFNIYMTMTAARSRFDDDNLCEFYPFEKLFKDSRPEDILFVDV